MQALLLEVEIDDSVNISELIETMKKQFSIKKITSLNELLDEPIKLFTGFANTDLKPINCPDFKIYSRDELYDR